MLRVPTALHLLVACIDDITMPIATCNDTYNLIGVEPALENMCFMKLVKLCVLMFPQFFRYSIDSMGQIHRDEKR